jgi:hypothetical protein
MVSRGSYGNLVYVLSLLHSTCILVLYPDWIDYDCCLRLRRHPDFLNRPSPLLDLPWETCDDALNVTGDKNRKFKVKSHKHAVGYTAQHRPLLQPASLFRCSLDGIETPSDHNVNHEHTYITYYNYKKIELRSLTYSFAYFNPTDRLTITYHLPRHTASFDHLQSLVPHQPKILLDLC